jgi:hypothetical protein
MAGYSQPDLVAPTLPSQSHLLIRNYQTRRYVQENPSMSDIFAVRGTISSRLNLFMRMLFRNCSVARRQNPEFRIKTTESSWINIVE